MVEGPQWGQPGASLTTQCSPYQAPSHASRDTPALPAPPAPPPSPSRTLVLTWPYTQVRKGLCRVGEAKCSE